MHVFSTLLKHFAASGYPECNPDQKKKKKMKNLLKSNMQNLQKIPYLLFEKHVSQLVCLNVISWNHNCKVRQKCKVRISRYKQENNHNHKCKYLLTGLMFYSWHICAFWKQPDTFYSPNMTYLINSANYITNKCWLLH